MTTEPLTDVPVLEAETPAARTQTDTAATVTANGAGPHDLTLIRSDDLLHLGFDFINLRLDTAPGRPAKLVRVDPSQAALIIVHFPPQHFNEQTFSTNPPLPRPAQARLSGATRLAFRLPAGLNEIPYTVESLLDWRRFEPSLAPTALPPGPPPAETPPPAEPGPQQTAIELPYRLILSPDRTGTWEHATAPVVHQGRAELWHTRLRVAEQPKADPSLRAVWSPDFPNGAPPRDFGGPISKEQRREIVRLTSDFTLAPKTNNALPRPIRADLLMLTPFGGYLKSRGAWNPPLAEQLTVASWRHVATLGRDHSVRVDQIGFLLPFGHRVIRVTATERDIVGTTTGQGATPVPAAMLRKRSFLVIDEPEKRYDGEAQAAYPFKGREMPLPGVRIQLNVTPDLAPPVALPSTGGAFWVQVLQNEQPVDFQFPLAVTDAAGRTAELSAPMLFVPGNVVQADGAQMAEARRRYEVDLLGAAPRRTATAGGNRIAYAPPPTPASDDTSLATERVLFGIDKVPAASTGSTPFLPKVQEVAARIPAVEAVTGVAQAVEAQFFKKYLDGVLDGQGNQAAVFMSFKQQIATHFTPENAGGLVATALPFTGVSRTLGAVAGDLPKLADGLFDQGQIEQLVGSNARLLGTISLLDVINPVFDQGQIPKLLSETVRSAAGIAEKIVARMNWNPQIKDVGPFKARRETQGNQTLPAKLAIKTTVEQPLGPGAPTYSVEGDLADFSIEFLQLLTINFARLSFTSRSGEKAIVRPELAGGNPVVFRQELNFLDELRKQIPAEAFGKLPRLDVTTQGVDVSYSLALPPLAFGAFTLQNVVLDGGLFLPFVGQPARVRFSFGTRANPFNLSVLAIGGGGFAGIEVAMDRVVVVEAALEFGGNAALNLGVARAAVWVMGGVYFKLADLPDSESPRMELAAYIRYGGSASVLGLITVSVEFYLALTYDPQANTLHGQAKMTVKVKIAFFSKSVTLSVERTIKGPDLPGDARALALADGGASFGDMFDEVHWQQYAAAFA